MAKSKMYKIKEPPEECPLELDEMKYLSDNYTIYTRSLW